MALINLTLAKTMTGITDDTTCQFYIDATLKKIEKIILRNFLILLMDSKDLQH